MSALLARPQIAKLNAYTAAAQQPDTTRLNANEVSWNPGADFGSPAQQQLNRYPQVRPWQLREHLASLYGVSPEQLLVTRGSSEAIDLLLRVFCIPSMDNIVITPPTFGMYRVYADVQQASVKELRLRAENNFQLDIGQLLATADKHTKIIFLCSPNNPTGNSLSSSDIESLLANRMGQSIVVVDEAYIEFSQGPSVLRLMAKYENLAVLRTMSKAHGLAATRIGTVIANPDVIRLLDSVLAPYAVSAPVIELGLQALSAASLARTELSVKQLLVERNRVIDALSACTIVDRVWHSDANFVLARFRNLAEALKKLAAGKILIRDFSAEPGLRDCARVTIGSRSENDRLLVALQEMEQAR